MRVGKPLRLSPSSIALFKRCSMQFKWSVLDEIEPEPKTGNYYSVLGKAFHKAMELNDAFNIPEDKLRSIWKYIFYYCKTEEAYLDENLEYQDFISRGYDLLKNGIELRDRWIQTSNVVWNEKYFRIAFPNKHIDDVYFSGRIDLTVKNKISDIYTVIDWKTAKKESKEIDTDPQMSIYIYFLHNMFKVPYENLFGALAYPSTSNIIFTQRTASDIEQVFEDSIKMLECIANGVFVKKPKEEDGKKGDCFFCPYKSRCRKVKI